jgi:SAM-dependent methyltransferase
MLQAGIEGETTLRTAVVPSGNIRVYSRSGAPDHVNSPLLTSNAQLPVALRPVVDFPPVRGSIFDDPGDEKSWHISQRSDALNRFYADREPAWYGSAISSLQGADRALDLGCGPGLSLQALLEQGCSSVLGVDRWPDFAANSTPETPIIAHDLSLPMPFLESGSFDGVFSHYALDYVSPICLRQVLREAHRLLAPGGRLVIYVAAVGLGGGDEARTASYTLAVLRVLLAEASFAEIDVQAASEGRNSIAKARRGADDLDAGQTDPQEVAVHIAGDTQVSAAFAGDPEAVRCELVGEEGRTATFTLELSPADPIDAGRVSVCARALAQAAAGTELQLWVWRGLTPVAMECARLEFAAAELRLSAAGSGCEHVSTWKPGELPVEPVGNAHSRFEDLRPGDALSVAERGEEGRQVVVEPARPLPPDTAEQLRPGRNRFLVKRAPGLDLDIADREWLGGRLHGIALSAGDLDGEGTREWLLWAAWRQAMVYLSGPDWKSILQAASEKEDELRSPLILVDPAASGDGPSEAPPPELIDFAMVSNRRFVLLGPACLDLVDQADLRAICRHLLYSGPHGDNESELPAGANENLRYLTERTLLMRLRQAHGFSPAEVGRRSSTS